MPKQLENDAFLTQLTKLFQKSQKSGSVCVSMKRYVQRKYGEPIPKDNPDMDIDDDITPQNSSPQLPTTTTARTEYPVIFRANVGNTKMNTIVEPGQMGRFLEAYGNIAKLCMEGLKKKERSRKKKEEGGDSKGKGNGKKADADAGVKGKGKKGKGKGKVKVAAKKK